MGLPSADRQLVCVTVVDVRGGWMPTRSPPTAEGTLPQLQAMVAGLNAVVWERDPDTLRIRYINDRAEEMFGYPAEQWLDDSELWPGILHPDDRETALRRVRQAVAQDVDFSLSYRARTRDGRWLWLQHLGHVVRDDAGNPVALHVVLIDITESRRREEAAALLAATSRALAAPGSVEQRLGEVVALTLGPLGDRAAVWLRADDDRYRLAAAAPTEAAEPTAGLPPLTVPEELAPMVDADRPFTVGEVSEDMRRVAAGGDGRYALAPTGGERSRLVVPLVAGRQRLGLVTLSLASPHRPYDDADLDVAGELGQRIAAMVAAERVATRQRQLQELNSALSAAATVAEATAAVTAGLREALDASVVSVSTVGSDGRLHTIEARGYPAERLGAVATMPLSAPFPPRRPPAPAARCGCPTAPRWSISSRRPSSTSCRPPRRWPCCRCWPATGRSGR